MSQMSKPIANLNTPPNAEASGWFGYFYFYFYGRHTGDPSLPAGESH